MAIHEFELGAREKDDVEAQASGRQASDSRLIRQEAAQ